MGCTCIDRTSGTIHFLFTLWVNNPVTGLDVLEDKLESLKCGYDRLTELCPCTDEQEGEYELLISQKYNSTNYSYSWSDDGCDSPETVEEMDYSLDEVKRNLKESLKNDDLEISISNPTVYYH